MSRNDYIAQPSARTTLDALQAILQRGGVERLDVAVAYVTNSGVHDLLQRVSNTLGGDWAAVPKRWITSLLVGGSVPPAAAVPVSAVEPDRSAYDWHAILAALKISGMARELGQHCELRDLAGARMVLRLSPAHRHLLIKPEQDKLQQSLAEHFGRPLQLAIER